MMNAMKSMRAGLAGAALSLLAGCALDRGPTNVCTASGGAGVVSNALPGMTETLRDVMRAQPGRGAVEIDVLSLSAGGQFGAFGAGFLRGWSENDTTPLPQFDLVTGVSVGAILAPLIFAGERHSPSLDLFRGLEDDDVLRRRSLLALPFSASLSDPSPLANILQTRLNDDVIADMAARHRGGAQLLVLATNLDTTRVQQFDLGAVAASDVPVQTRRDCLTEILLASGAIPGVFPPRNINDALYVDGGLREHVFLRSVESARTALARETGREINIRATIVINGALDGGDGPVEDRLLPYIERSVATLADQVLRSSILDVVSFAQTQRNWSVRGVVADVPVRERCPGAQASGTFDPCVTTLLFDEGRARGSAAQIDFKTAAELNALARNIWGGE